jgi:hypothetical protein
MAGIFSYALAGAAAGVGKGLVQQATDAKEERQAEIKFARDQLMAKEGRDFQADENKAQRTFATSERQEGQTFQAGENAATRSANAGAQTAAARLAMELENLRASNSADAAVLAREDAATVRGDARAQAVEDRDIAYFRDTLDAKDKREFDAMSAADQRAFVSSEADKTRAAATARDAAAARVNADAATAAADVTKARDERGIGASVDAATAADERRAAAAATGVGAAADAAKALAESRADAAALAAKEGASEGLLNRELQERMLAERVAADEATQTRALAARADEFAKTMANGGTIIRTNDGTVGYRVGKDVVEAIGPDGKPIKMAADANEKLYNQIFAAVMTSPENIGLPAQEVVAKAMKAAAQATTAAPTAPRAAEIPRPKSREERDALPPGTDYIAPNGLLGRTPL